MTIKPFLVHFLHEKLIFLYEKYHYLDERIVSFYPRRVVFGNETNSAGEQMDNRAHYFFHDAHVFELGGGVGVTRWPY